MESVYKQQRFAILSAKNPKLAIQCPSTAGDAITIERFDANSRIPDSQLWSVQLQNPASNGFVGVAFVNPITNLAVTFNGFEEKNYLHVADFSSGSFPQNAWLITGCEPKAADQFRIGYAVAPKWNWTNPAGYWNPGDSVWLRTDQNTDSLWTMFISSLTEPEE